MSKSIRGGKPIGFEYGSKLNCNRTYTPTGKLGKKEANSERRSKGKRAIKEELSN